MRPLLAVLLASLLGTSSTARDVTVRGTVTDQLTGLPVGAATLTVVGAPVGARTDGAGRYVLRVSVTTPTLLIEARRVGYQRKQEERAVASIVGDTLTVDFVMSQTSLQLSAITNAAAVDPISGRKAPYSVAKLDASGFPLPTTGAAAAIATNESWVQLRSAPSRDPEMNTEEYSSIVENSFLSVGGNPLSTFGVDVDRASYANVRRFVHQRRLPPKGAVRIEEMINYFTYDYASPTGTDPIVVHTDVAPAPWKPAHQIVRVGLQARRIDTDKLPPANLVFLIDVSGSMDGPGRLPLVKEALRLLVTELREQDRVAIVVYAGAAGVVLPSTSAANKATILEALSRLNAGGSTAGGAGIRLAYQVAKDNFIAGANNRVILATDGDFNLGVSNTQELVDIVEAKRADGIFLTVLGFGMGNLKDARMEQLADKGNGNYAYVDDVAEARKVLVTEMGGTLFTVAKDVKLQVEFNPMTVQAYRLIGYENRALAKEDFANDAKDAGEMGAGHTVTALYEIVPVGTPLDVDVGSTPALKYQTPQSRVDRSKRQELMTVSVRFKEPQGERSRMIQQAVVADNRGPSADLRFAMAVAGYGMLLRESPHVGAFTYDLLLNLASDGVGTDREGYRAEFISLVRETIPLVRKVSAPEGR